MDKYSNILWCIVLTCIAIAAIVGVCTMLYYIGVAIFA